MIRNYLKIAIRNLFKQKGFSLINIFGLSVGFACFTLFMLYAVNEFNFDRFHKNSNNIYRVYQWNNLTNTGDTYHPIPLGPAMKQDLPGVEEYVRIRNAWQESFIKSDDKVDQAKISFADPQFFSVFSFKFREGNATTALKDLYSVVLTEEMAKRIWGKIDVVGKTIEVKVQDKYEPFVVTAIIENIPSNSSIAFQMLGNFDFLTTVTPDGRGQVNDWNYSSSQTYIKLRQPNSLNAVKKGLAAFYRKYNATGEEEARKKGWKGTELSREYGLQPLRSIHTDTNLKGTQVAAIDPKTIWILLGIATGILLISCINFTTLAVGRSIRRAKEIGVRKVMGGNKRSLIFQFMTEALLLTILSAVLGLLLLRMLLPFFNHLSERELHFSFVQFPELGWLMASLILLVGILAGSYPALVLSGFKTVEVLKTKVKLSGSNLFTRSLVTIQFVLSAGLIFSTFIILQQLNYMESKNPGFNKENIIVVNAGGTWPREIYPFFKQQIVAYPEIIGVTGSDQNLGGTSYSNTEVDVNGRPKKIYEFFVEQDYLQIMGMQLLTGRDFNPAIASDTVNAVIINETMMKDFGWTPDKVIGQQIKGYRKNLTPVIIGVVKDFNFQSFSVKIEPQMFHQISTYRPYKYFVRIRPGDPSASLAVLQTTWKKIVPDLPFRYSFLNEDLNRIYKSESRWSNIVGWASGISIFLACLGLLGLAALAVTNRTKEIGIRKVLGASFTSITGLISKDFLKLVLIAFIIASPLAWYFMNKWLQDYAYRINISWWVFAITGTVTILIGLLTVSFQAIKAAIANPVKSLRTE